MTFVSLHSFTARLMGKSKLIQPNATRKIRIRFAANDPGRYEDTLELVFAQLQPRAVSLITRKVFATVGDPELHERLKPEAPYSRKSAPTINLTGNVVPGIRPPEWSRTKWNEKLLKYDVPPYVIEAAFGKKARDAVQNIRRLMPQVFNTQSYGAWFQHLLYVEEEQLRSVFLFFWFLRFFFSSTLSTNADFFYLFSGRIFNSMR